MVAQTDHEGAKHPLAGCAAHGHVLTSRSSLKACQVILLSKHPGAILPFALERVAIGRLHIAWTRFVHMRDHHAGFDGVGAHALRQWGLAGSLVVSNDAAAIHTVKGAPAECPKTGA
jgi:hypothetical protein